MLLHQRRGSHALFVSGARNAAMYVAGMSSSGPGGNSAKKLTRKLSQSTLRRLVTLRGDAVARDVERQRVAELHAERFGDAVLERHARRRPPRVCGVQNAPLDTRLPFGSSSRPRQVELALGKPSRTRIAELRRVERRRRSPRRGGRAPSAGTRTSAPTPFAQLRARIVDLLGQHVDQELVRRVGRQARAPVAHEIAAHDGEQQQRHQVRAPARRSAGSTRTRAGAGWRGRSAT